VLSLIVPVYRSEANLPALLHAVKELAQQTPLEVVFVVDGSPDRCAEILARELKTFPAPAWLLLLSRNFGSFAAITAGLAHGTGDYFAMLAADLQEPPELILQYVARLSSGEVDVVIGQRTGRADPWISRTLSNTFWSVFRKFAVADIPKGGVDTFACSRQVRDQLIALRESESSLVSLLFWLGFRRELIPFTRQERKGGKSSWTFGKKLNYAIHSFFNFTDLPVRVLLLSGALSSALAVLLGSVILIAKLAGRIEVPGYTALALLTAFFGGTTTFGLGLIGQYIWLTLQNARNRPNYVVRSMELFGPGVTGPPTE
jgi:polyisoprenyl-phosphate glycosyltransferase